MEGEQVIPMDEMVQKVTDRLRRRLPHHGRWADHRRHQREWRPLHARYGGGGASLRTTPATIQVNYFVVYLLMAPSRYVPYRPVEYQAWGDR